MKIEMVPIGRLVPYARNARVHDEAQIAALADSIRAYGFNAPVLIDTKGGIIAGHGRVMAAQRLACQKVPCIRLAHLTEAQKRAYIIADNKLAEKSRWDLDILRNEVEELLDAGTEAGLLAFDDEEIDRLINEYTTDLGPSPLDANAAGQESRETEPEEPAPPAPRPDKPSAILIPIVINLTHAEMARWRAVKKQAGLTDNGAAFRRLTGIEDGQS